ncbi:hypothetical protein CKM354_000947700 [Cercospora kikuchii]|uniref:Uncharacterized protein n=1 Tax=Cercospora kikuchii TaxID=84275 RepID=A0A9P3FK17_9PEZI|nr:uncharacterized protein CKM354_000947700 [Cercospora kikuchii]GIZ46349.1 hypothetical protein CKM354_000947700 [Cercospora kikuchii]
MKQSRNNGYRGTFPFHWRAPAVMVSSLLAGVALAIGHHAFYASLAGAAVSSEPIKVVGWSTTQQQINIAVGTAFAFVVKASLILACSTAYIQLLFGALNRKAFKLEVLDNWFAGLGDLWSLGCVASYWRYPLLTLVALTCWLLPIAAIISPAALSVVFDRTYPSPVRSEFVPQPAFNSLAFSDLRLSEYQPTRHILQLKGQVEEVTRIAAATAAAGSILSIAPPDTNASWAVSFDAPRLACEEIQGELRQAIKENVQLVVAIASWRSPAGNFVEKMFTYMGWTAYSNDTSPLPFKQTLRTKIWELQTTGESPYFMGVGTDMFFGLFPRQVLAEKTFGYGVNTSDIITYNGVNMTLMDWYFEDATLLRCKIVPTTYDLNFTYSGVSQDQNIQVLAARDPPAIATNTTMLQVEAPDAWPLVMSVEGFSDVELDANNITEGAKETMRLMSFSAIQQAAHSFLLGAANTLGDKRNQAKLDTSLEKKLEDSTTNVFTTVLSQSRELAALYVNQPTVSEITNTTSGLSYDQALSMMPVREQETARSFEEMVTELYFNISLSMASSNRLTYNESSPLAPQRVNVTYGLYGNVYSYATDKLWLAYGIAIGVTVLNVIIGIIAICRTGASYTGNFSTIARAARNADIGADMREDRFPGSDPLPKSMAKAHLHLYGNETSSEHKHLGSVTVTERPPSSDLDT